jgi:decaprenyl-phosphate phosphoribosyltransferase
MSARADTIGGLMTDTSPRSATSRPIPADPAAAPVVEPSSDAPLVPRIPQEALLEEPRQSRLPAAIRAMRPRQWVKNVLVFTAPLAAGRLFERHVLLGSALAFVAFCLLSATVYLINDVRDVEEDRLHPRKRFRPIAAGELKPRAAVVLALITGAAGLTIGFLTAWQLGVTLSVYLLLQLGYSAFLKHLPVVDLAMVASGFLLRAIAGGVASGIALSQWFLLVAAFGSFFMVAGKRYSEIKSLGSGAGTRKSLERYSESYLRFAWMLAAVMVLISYSLWAFDNRAQGAYGVPWTAISIAPFTLGLLQYALEVDSGNAGEPEEVVLHDRVLQVIGLVWLVVISIAVFTG